MVIVIIISAIMLIMGIVIIIGKGDNLIAGYNTASKEEKAQVNIKRLRGLIGGFMIALAPMTFFSLREESMEAMWAFIAITLVLCIVVLILANTWAKKKNE